MALLCLGMMVSLRALIGLMVVQLYTADWNSYQTFLVNTTEMVSITVARLSILPNVSIVVVYRSQRIPVQQLCLALAEVLQPLSTYQIIIGDFNINWCNVTDTW